MCSYILSFDIEQINTLIGIITPVILLVWFYYSQNQTLSKIYYDQIIGLYAGFTDPINNFQLEGLNAGIIMNIREIDDRGYFRGDLDYGETTHNISENRSESHKIIREGLFTFWGKFNFRLYINIKGRHPFNPEENRIYIGKLYIVDRLDILFDSYKIENYVKAEYSIVHYREMQTMKFTLFKVHKIEGDVLPQSFLLHKKFGVTFEPYSDVRDIIFRGNTRVGN